VGTKRGRGLEKKTWGLGNISLGDKGLKESDGGSEYTLTSGNYYKYRTKGCPPSVA